MILPILLSVLMLPVAQARWADVSEADSAVNFENLKIKVKKDASYVIEVEYQAEILKESARQRVGLTRMSYDSRASKFNLLEAYTINGDKKVKVRSEHIEIKPLASTGPGFDEISQVTIAFPDVQVGSKIYYRYKREVSKPHVPGVYWTHYPIGWNENLQKHSLQMESEIPLYFESHDPENKLKFDKKDDRNFTITLKEPVFRMIVEEENAKMNAKSTIWLGISSIKDWSQVPENTLQAYEKVIASDLPENYQAIVEQAKKEKTPIDQINAVTSKLADTVRYVGDWAPIEGAYHPRALNLVVDTGFGDCKDFSAGTSAMLRKLGFDARVAWVVRDRRVVETPIRLPGPYFNHAIVWAKKDGKEYWIDPTNIQSFAQGLFEDIAGRRAVVLRERTVDEKSIPAASEKDSVTQLNIRVKFNKTRIAESDGQISIEGGDIVGMTGAELSYAKAALDFSFLTWITNPATLTEWSFSNYSLNSRIVKPFKADFKFKENWSAVVTSAGRGYMVKPPAHLDPFVFKIEKRVSDLHLGNPRSMHRNYRFVGTNAQVKGSKFRCHADSPWLKFSREFRRHADSVILDEDVILKKSSVTQAEIQSKAFSDLQARISQCQLAAVLILN